METNITTSEPKSALETPPQANLGLDPATWAASRRVNIPSLGQTSRWSSPPVCST
ncbi:MAG TPA: hypothetical protein VFS76_12980 [Pyrinomonadaceae bacterium]|nr:hypothetical protein [Pyrinomonadaceae bacterium]